MKTILLLLSLLLFQVTPPLKSITYTKEFGFSTWKLEYHTADTTSNLHNQTINFYKFIDKQKVLVAISVNNHIIATDAKYIQKLK